MLPERLASPDSKVHVAHMGPPLGPVGSRWAPCWPHEPSYQGGQVYGRWKISHFQEDRIFLKSPARHFSDGLGGINTLRLAQNHDYYKGISFNILPYFDL